MSNWNKNIFSIYLDLSDSTSTKKNSMRKLKKDSQCNEIKLKLLSLILRIFSIFPEINN